MIILLNLRHYDRKLKTMLNKKVLVDDKKLYNTQKSFIITKQQQKVNFIHWEELIKTNSTAKTKLKNYESIAKVSWH